MKNLILSKRKGKTVAQPESVTKMYDERFATTTSLNKPTRTRKQSIPKGQSKACKAAKAKYNKIKKERFRNNALANANSRRRNDQYDKNRAELPMLHF